MDQAKHDAKPKIFSYHQPNDEYNESWWDFDGAMENLNLMFSIGLVIANNDEMALGAISALQSAGYNKQNAKTIPVFGVDATDAARSAIKAGSMTGTIKQDSEGMAEAMLHLVENFTEGNDKFKGIDLENVVGDWRVNIPYSAYTGE